MKKTFVKLLIAFGVVLSGMPVNQALAQSGLMEWMKPGRVIRIINGCQERWKIESSRVVVGKWQSAPSSSIPGARPRSFREVTTFVKKRRCNQIHTDSYRRTETR